MRVTDNYCLILAKFSLFINQINLNLLSPLAKPTRHNALVKIQVCSQKTDFVLGNNSQRF